MARFTYSNFSPLQIVKICLQYICHDPNYNYDDDDDEAMEMEADEEEEE